MYDLLIKGGKVIDPAQNINKRMDIAIQGARIAALTESISPAEAHAVVDASGKIVTPGLIDAHCHVYVNVNPLGAHPDDAGVRQAVTTVIDAGSAGAATFGGFPKYVNTSAQTTVYCLLHVSSVGLSVLPEMRDWSEIDADAIAATVKANRGLIKGIKLRMVGKFIAANGLEVFKRAKKIAKDNKLPINVHIGDFDKTTPEEAGEKRNVVPATLPREFVPLMERGDILTHIYTAQRGNILLGDKGVIPEVKEAERRGVIFDMCPGRMNFSYRSAAQCLDAGVLPHIVATDVVQPSLSDRIFGLTAVMSRLLALGFKLEQLVEMTTINPARVYGIDNAKGSLKPGMDADVSIVEIVPANWEAPDAEGKTILVKELIMPRACVKAGKYIPSNPVALPVLKE